MKKLLVVMLVLGMASMANAALYLTINGTDNPTDTIEAVTGDVLTIDIYGDGATLPSQFFMDAAGEGQTDDWNCDGVTIGYGGTNKFAVVLTEDIGIAIPYVYFMLDDVPSGTNLKLPLGPTPKPLIATILLTVGLTEESTEATSVITLRDGDTIPLDGNPTYSVHVTPEPITVALLGLGGLMLRRRK